ncbi:MAG: biopolymer transporter ExbD [Sedimentisphaeraceae bacterium JB056]
MLLKRLREHKGYFTFNMMPIIDIVLLLIIFFMFVCRYIAAENFAIRVPDEATNAITDATETPGFVTVSVWFDEDEDLLYCAVGVEVMDITDGVDITAIVELINSNITDDVENAIVNLRMNQELVFSQYADVIKAISNSNATDLSIAAFEDVKD